MVPASEFPIEPVVHHGIVGKERGAIVHQLADFALEGWRIGRSVGEPDRIPVTLNYYRLLFGLALPPAATIEPPQWRISDFISFRISGGLGLLRWRFGDNDRATAE